ALEAVAERPQVRSFADLTLAEWMTAWGVKFHADHGRLPAPGSRYRAETALRGLLPRLAIQYSDAPWWKHDVWCLRFDPRIPRREHEPRGESSVRWDDIQPRWLRDGYTFYLYLQLESGQLTWSSVAPWRVFAARFSEFLISRGIDHPALAGDPSGLRPLVLDFRVFLRQWRRGTTGQKERGGPLDDRSVACTQRVIGNFYRAMHDYRADVAAATGDDRWLELTDSHARLYRVEECRTGRVIREADELQLHQRRRPVPHARLHRAARPAPRPGHDHHPGRPGSPGRRARAARDDAGLADPGADRAAGLR